MSNVLWQALHTTPAIFPELTRRATAPGEVEASAHATLERVERQAQALMEAARHKASALMEAGHREGLVQGRAEAIAEAQNGLRDVTQSVSKAAERLQALETECRTHADEMVVSLALAVAERILQVEIARDPNAILKIVRGALALLPTCMTFHVFPSRTVGIVATIITALIAISTITLKEHFVLDVIAGTILALATGVGVLFNAPAMKKTSRNRFTSTLVYTSFSASTSLVMRVTTRPVGLRSKKARLRRSRWLNASDRTCVMMRWPVIRSHSNWT